MVNTVCAVVCCRREAYPGCGIPFHRVPGHPAVRKKWVETVPGNITTSAVVCGYHFKQDDYVEGSKKKLKFGSVPSVFPNCELWLKVVSNGGIVQLPMEEVKNLQACYHHKNQYLKEINLSNKPTNESSDHSDNESIHQEKVSSTRSNRNKRKMVSKIQKATFDSDRSAHNAVDDRDNVTYDIGDNNEDENCEVYQCDECKKQINGFRYTCVQCADWDLCGACEARGAHDAHYVLRVPRDKTYKETKAVLDIVKEQLLRNNTLARNDNLDDRIKELKSEVPQRASSPRPLVKTEGVDSDGDYVVETLEDEWLSDEKTDEKSRKRSRPQNNQSVPTKKVKSHSTSQKRQPKNMQEPERSPETETSTEPTLIDNNDVTQQSKPTLVLSPLSSQLSVKSEVKDTTKRKPTADVSSPTDVDSGVGNRNVVRLQVPSNTNEGALVQVLQSQAYVMMKPLKKLSDVNK